MNAPEVPGGQGGRNRRDRVLRVGIIGCGNVALHDHLPALAALRDQYQVVAVADPVRERLDLVGNALALAAEDRYEDPAQLIRRPDVDLIDICTPPHLHRRFVEAAAAAGRSILCEKPLATTPADADAMILAARSAGVALAAVQNYLSFPEIVALRAQIYSGSIGQVSIVTIDSLGMDDNPGVAAYRPHWRHDLGAGGGVLMDLIHYVYVAEALLGGPASRVSAWLDSQEIGDAVESMAVCRLETDRAMATINIGWGTGPGGIRVRGSDGWMEIRYADGRTGPYLPIELAAIHQGAADVHRSLEVSGPRDTHRLFLGDLASELTRGQEPTSGSDAAHAVSVVVAAYRAAATGSSVVLPLPPDDPVYRSGVGGILELDLPRWSPVRVRGLFGVKPA